MKMFSSTMSCVLLGCMAFLAFVCTSESLMASRPPRQLRFGEVKLWDVASRQEKTLWSLRGDQSVVGDGIIRSAVFSADGKLLAVPGVEAMVTVWEAKTGRILYELPVNPSYRHQPILSLAFLPGGEELIVMADSEAKIWNLNTGTTRQSSLHGPPDGVSPDGTKRATIDHSANTNSSTIRLLDVTTGKELFHTPGSFPLAFSPDSGTLGMTKDNRTDIVLYTISTGGQKILHHDYQQLNSLAFSPDGRVLASAGLRRKPRSPGLQEEEQDEGIITLWDTKTGERQAELTGHTVPIQTLAFSPDGRQLVSAGSQYRPDPTDTNIPGCAGSGVPVGGLRFLFDPTDWIASSYGIKDERSPLWFVPPACAGAVALLLGFVCWQCFRVLRANNQPRTAKPKA